MVFAAMTPCMRLYAWLGASLDAAAAEPYAEWVRTYAAPEFEVLAARLERLLDERDDDGPAVRATYRRAMRLELAFFDAAPELIHGEGRARTAASPRGLPATPPHSIRRRRRTIVR